MEETVKEKTRKRRIEVHVTVKAIPGDRVWVVNYRKSDVWELGEVRATEISVDNVGLPHVSYRIWVARTPKNPRGRYGYFLSVSGDKIDTNVY